ncbi:nitroreductase [Kitasatospora xanthocidica]|uniref:Nitroreductase n=1 Tax=Kitasatospora xanthocidica TaxID=83382 RepID=A0A373A240_9ACTN|nr:MULTISPECIES: nitroreductase [Streptomycetaceae]OKI03542.1 NADH dehydrogenase [Streptomyces sp. CB02056]RGD62218.1 nitroreductase [Kitasatospora xanthocidica]
MDVYEAVETRRAVRGFTDQPVPREVLERVLAAASRAPSGANLQPWHTYLVTGERLERLKRLAVARASSGDQGDDPEFEMYPPELKSPYQERRREAAEQRYRAFGIPREDRDARQRAVVRNWDCFGAPTALFSYIDRSMGPAQWADLGMYLQTVMLLLRAEGLHSCPQMAWSVYHRTVADVLSPPASLVLFCGLSVGHPDPAAPRYRVGRAPLDQTVTILD